MLCCVSLEGTFLVPRCPSYYYTAYTAALDVHTDWTLFPHCENYPWKGFSFWMTHTAMNWIRNGNFKRPFEPDSEIDHTFEMARLHNRFLDSFYVFRQLTAIHVPLSPTTLYVAPTTWRVKNYVVFGLQLQVLQWANFKSEDRFVIPRPNGIESFKAWLAQAPISSHILPFKKGVFGVLSGPWIETCMMASRQHCPQCLIQAAIWLHNLHKWKNRV